MVTRFKGPGFLHSVVRPPRVQERDEVPQVRFLYASHCRPIFFEAASLKMVHFQTAVCVELDMTCHA